MLERHLRRLSGAAGVAAQYLSSYGLYELLYIVYHSAHEEVSRTTALGSCSRKLEVVKVSVHEAEASHPLQACMFLYLL